MPTTDNKPPEVLEEEQNPSNSGRKDTISDKEISIDLAPNWDATLTYDMLENEDSKELQQKHMPIFVGRTDMMGAIVNAIQQPDRRGTFLISGYRGAGKTSMVIKAAYDAKKLLKNHSLLPLVLNVSEVSASIELENKENEQTLQIDARKMLVALLRTLKNKFEDSKSNDKGDVLNKLKYDVLNAYKKATASQFL